MNTIRIIQFFARLLQGATPVDGCARADEKIRDRTADRPSPDIRDEALQRAESEPHAPVRWGNFR